MKQLKCLELISDPHLAFDWHYSGDIKSKSLPYHMRPSERIYTLVNLATPKVPKHTVKAILDFLKVPFFFSMPNESADRTASVLKIDLKGRKSYKQAASLKTENFKNLSYLQF